MQVVSEYFLNWFPMLLLIAVWIFFMRGPMARSRTNCNAQLTYLKDHLAETKRLNANLERIAAALEQRGGKAP